MCHALARLISLAAALLTYPALATTQDDFRAMIWAGDMSGVKAALQAVEASDLASSGEPDAERALFHIFLESHPKVAAFTESWLAAEPDSALAMTARGWQLYSTGHNMRGTSYAREVYADASRADHDYGKQAFDLAERAVVADPNLISASDLILRSTNTLGNRQMIPLELERIMALHPNRGSLMKVMGTLSQQWGGKLGQVQLVCDR